jgi:hypothetical protein
MTWLGGFDNALLRLERTEGNGWKKRKEKKRKTGVREVPEISEASFHHNDTLLFI